MTALAAALLVLAGVFVGGAGVEASGKTSTPPTCTDTFTSSGGDFLTSANWSNGVPGAQDVACIPAGTGEVTMIGETVSVGSLIMSGNLLTLGNICNFQSSLNTVNGLTISNGSVVQMVDWGNCQLVDSLSGGLITNQGTINLFPNGPRTIQANLLNQGTVALEDANDGFPADYNGSGTTFDNQGIVSIGSFDTFTVTGGASFTNDTGGSVNSATPYSDSLVLNGGGTFTEGNGTTTTNSNSSPVVVDDANLAYTGNGASFVQIEGTSGLSGNIATGQTLQMANTCPENVTVTAASSFTNAGTINQVDGGNCANTDKLVISSGTLTNQGTINLFPNGPRAIQGNLLNRATVALEDSNDGFPANFNGSGTIFDNEGTVSIGSFDTFTVTGGASFNNDTGGSVNNSAYGLGLLLNAGGTFTEGNGTTTTLNNSSPVVVDDANVAYDPTSSPGSSIVQAQGTDTLSGNIGVGQTLQIENTCAESVVVTAASGTSNAGTIILTDESNCQNSDTLAGTLTNSGSLQTITGSGGPRNLNLTLTNNGTVTIDDTTSYSGSLLNQGTIAIADGINLNAASGATITNGSTGAIDASSATGTGDLFLSSATFDEQGGTTLGANPVIVDDGAVNFSGTKATGASAIDLRGTNSLSGNTLANETLLLESTCSENVLATAAKGFTNSGTIVETNGDGCGNNATLKLRTGTLTNNGTIETSRANGGQRIIQGNVANAKTVNLDSGINLQVQGTYTQSTKGNLLTNIGGGNSFGTMSVTGAATLAGDGEVVLQNSFVPNVGASFGILNATSLSGTVAKLTNAVINKTTSTYFQPTYSTSAFSLVVAQATASAPTSALPGQVIAVSGAGWTPNDTITVTFTTKSGKKTTLTSIVADAGGNFTGNETIPTTATTGTGKLTFTSTITGVAVTDLVSIK